MKFWKGQIGTQKEGMYGSRDDTGSVSDSTEVPRAEYEAWVAAQPAAAPVNTQLANDIAALDITNPTNANMKLRALLERLRVNEM